LASHGHGVTRETDTSQIGGTGRERFEGETEREESEAEQMGESGLCAARVAYNLFMQAGLLVVCVHCCHCCCYYLLLS